MPMTPVTLAGGLLTGPPFSLSGSPKKQKALWLEQLLQLVQEKNSLVAEEAELMITVQELNLEEKQWQLDQKLRTYINREGGWDVGRGWCKPHDIRYCPGNGPLV